MAKLTELRPMLIANDLTETIGFYTSRLGFECTGMWTPPDHEDGVPVWCQVVRDGVALMFNKGDPEPHEHENAPGLIHADVPEMSGSIYINVDDVDALFAELQPTVETFEWEPATFPHGMREFALRDCNGYLLVFGADAG
ncbi:MAG TPA: VOC family protein [Acidimicrobiales bacterium]|nr:VOC family protein [Acidimicrobiales bacterium]